MGYKFVLENSNHPILKSFINGDVTKKNGHFGGYIYGNKKSNICFRVKLFLNHSQLQMKLDGVEYNLVEKL